MFFQLSFFLNLRFAVCISLIYAYLVKLPFTAIFLLTLIQPVQLFIYHSFIYSFVWLLRQLILIECLMCAITHMVGHHLFEIKLLFLVFLPKLSPLYSPENLIDHYFNKHTNFFDSIVNGKP